MTVGSKISQSKIEQAKEWWCPGQHGRRHVMGLVFRNGSGIRELMLYREAIDPSVEAPQDVDVIAIVVGQVCDVRCSLCGAVRTWTPGEEALRQLLGR